MVLNRGHLTDDLVVSMHEQDRATTNLDDECWSQAPTQQPKDVPTSVQGEKQGEQHSINDLDAARKALLQKLQAIADDLLLDP